MEFGFGFLVLFFVIFFGVGRMCGWGRRCRRDDQGELGPSDKEYERRLSDLESRVKGRVASGAVSDRLVRPMANRTLFLMILLIFHLKSVFLFFLVQGELFLSYQKHLNIPVLGG